MKNKWRSESLEVLSKLCENLIGVDPNEQWKIRRHCYFYSGQHLQNRSLGYEEIKRGNELGILSVGFGCLHYAIEQVASNNRGEACRYAKEGKAAFEKLLAIDTPKYGRLLAYPLILAVLGNRQEAIDVTGQAVKLLGVDQNKLHDHNEEMNRLLKFAEKGS